MLSYARVGRVSSLLSLVVFVVRGSKRDVPPSRFHEFVVRALLDDPRALSRVLEDADSRRVPNRAQSVRDDDSGSPRRVAVREEAVERRLHELLALVVERGGGLVKEQDARFADDRPRDGDPLLLPAAHEAAADAHLRVVPVRHRGDESVRVGDFRRVHHLLPGRRRAAFPRGDVLVHAPAEQRRLLLDDADLRPEPHRVEVAQVHAVHGHAPRRRVPRAVDENRRQVLARILLRGVLRCGPRRGVVEPLDELHRGGFPAAALADQSDGLAWARDEVDPAEDRGLALRVREPDAPELDLAFEIVDDGAQRASAASRLRGGFGNRANLHPGVDRAGGAVDERLRVDRGHAVDEGEDAPRRDGRGARVARERGGLPRARGAESERPQRFHEVVEIELTLRDEPGAPPEGERVEEHRHPLRGAERGRAQECLVALLLTRDVQQRVVRAVHPPFHPERLHLADHRRNFAHERGARAHRRAHRGVPRGEVGHVDRLADG